MTTPLPTELDEITRQVIGMYSQYPYPLAGTHLDMFKDLVYPFIQNLGNVTSILEAGCGTGNVAIAMAQLLPNVRIVGIDLTEESLKLARESVAKLKLDNLEFRRSNLLEYDNDLGTFDFVHCQGVLHHLSAPEQGLENLYKYLKTGGYAYIWLYMLLGRRWILEFQDMLKLLGVAEMPYQEGVAWVRKIERMYHAKKKPVGLKRHKPVKKSEKQAKQVESEEKVRNTGLLVRVEQALRILNRKGGKALLRSIAQKFLHQPDSVHPEKPQVQIHPPDHESELEEQRYDTGLADTFLHPHSIFYRMADVLHLFASAGFDDVRISDGMSCNIDQFFGGEFPEIADMVAKLPVEKQYQFMELVEKPSGVGFFVHKPE